LRWRCVERVGKTNQKKAQYDKDFQEFAAPQHGSRFGAALLYGILQFGETLTEHFCGAFREDQLHRDLRGVRVSRGDYPRRILIISSRILSTIHRHSAEGSRV
jgi:hypothetical protein